jgi:two-component system OmpR family sensor kinase
MDHRNKIFLKSVRFKITLWYMLMLAVVLSVFSALIYQNLESRLYESVDNLIQSRAEGISDAIDTYWETKKFEATENESKTKNNTPGNASKAIESISSKAIQQASQTPGNASKPIESISSKAIQQANQTTGNASKPIESISSKAIQQANQTTGNASKPIESISSKAIQQASQTPGNASKPIESISSKAIQQANQTTRNKTIQQENKATQQRNKARRHGNKATRHRTKTNEDDEDSREAFSKADKINFARIARNWVEEKSKDVKLISTIVQIFDSDGNQIVSSKNISNKLILPREILNSTLKGNNELYDFEINLPGNKSLPLRVFIMPVIEHGQIAYIVQVASPLNLVYSGLNKLKATLLTLIPLTVFFTAALGVFLVKLTLNPVDSIIKTIRQITVENLELRIDIPDTKDEIKRLADTFNDMLARLDHAFSFQKQFIQDVSHELRTPLTILKGDFEITLKKSRSHHEYKSVLVSSLEEINKIIQMVEGLLTLARFDNQEIKFAMKRLELNALLESVLDDMRVLAIKKAISIDLLTPDKIILEADESQMRCVFVNLLDNAIKYTPSNGKVLVRIHKNKNFAKIRVSDTGIGIPENELHLVFDRFYQVEKSRSGLGFGLGLSIVRSILDAHHGRVEVESRQGQGTTFTISLPLSYSS